MSIIGLRSMKPLAMKDYDCDASVWLRNDGVIHGRGTGLTFAELRAVATARSHGWKILKGEKYIKQINIQDGDLMTYRAIPAMDAICQRLDMYADC